MCGKSTMPMSGVSRHDRFSEREVTTVRRGYVLLAVALLALAAMTTAAAMTPKHLYGKLLTTHFVAPAGYYKAEVGAGDLDARDRRNHQIGNVMVNLAGNAAVYYFVFPTRGWALRWTKDKPVSDPDIKVIRRQNMGRVPGFKGVTRWENLTIEGENAFGRKVRNGVTMMSVLKGNVVVGAATISTENEASGDVPATIKLLGSGLKHLAKVRR